MFILFNDWQKNLNILVYSLLGRLCKAKIIFQLIVKRDKLSQPDRIHFPNNFYKSWYAMNGTRTGLAYSFFRSVFTLSFKNSQFYPYLSFPYCRPYFRPEQYFGGTFVSVFCLKISETIFSPQSDNTVSPRTTKII